METTLQDDAVLLHRSDEEVREAAHQIRVLGADRVRLTAGWSVLAPGRRSRTKPAGPFDPADSSTYPQAGFKALDRAVRAVSREGLDVQIDIAFWAPRWAVARPSSNRDRHRFAPNAADFAAFSRAVARRYSGSFSDPEHHVPRLPAVRMYTTWNEPNHTSFLAPQWKKTRRGYRAYSPHVYRPMHEAAYAAIKDVSPANRVLIGGLSSFGSPVAGRGAVPPLEFLRTLACVDDRLRPLKVRECRGFTTLHADGLALHPYSVDVAPRASSPNPDDLYLADLPRADALVEVLEKQGRIDRRWPTYITEYGYETRPPDPYVLHTPEQQAQFLGEATFLAQRNPNVDMFAQFLLRDVSARDSGFSPSSKRHWRDWQTGLLYADGTPKPAAQAFKLPLHATYAVGLDGLPSVLLYGGVRPGSGRKVVRVERRLAGTETWEAVRTAGASCDDGTAEFFTDPDGFFTRAAAWDGPADYRLTWRGPRGFEHGAVVPVDASAPPVF